MVLTELNPSRAQAPKHFLSAKAKGEALELLMYVCCLFVRGQFEILRFQKFQKVPEGSENV